MITANQSVVGGGSSFANIVFVELTIFVSPRYGSQTIVLLLLQTNSVKFWILITPTFNSKHFESSSFTLQNVLLTILLILLVALALINSTIHSSKVQWHVCSKKLSLNIKTRSSKSGTKLKAPGSDLYTSFPLKENLTTSEENGATMEFARRNWTMLCSNAMLLQPLKTKPVDCKFPISLSEMSTVTTVLCMAPLWMSVMLQYNGI